MIESATFHVMTTELVVGSFALAGLCFVLHSFLIFQNKDSKFMPMMDTTAHIALLFGLLALPFAILSGINSSPSGAHTSPLLANKMLLSTAGGGLALGVLYARWKMHSDGFSQHIHNAFGSISTGCMLLTASLGGTYTRADSLTEFLPFVKENTLLLPKWMSIAVIVLIIAALVLRRSSTVKHG
ncbi:MAG: hypothetical protein CMA41_06285 [Euryarchaeota archaeon]|jgi:uncharacterized membrane protein YozB (DUF420 family)|nr:hypothetical protein [Euryarchaeota archaeon]MBF14853.1 hypothetical protein [Euryarchaeota archaeon]|tara:strand:- start:1039 stop:1590 length:552 start_codon:yes stop_codon:yes gene_type:complete